MNAEGVPALHGPLARDVQGVGLCGTKRVRPGQLSFQRSEEPKHRLLAVQLQDGPLAHRKDHLLLHYPVYDEKHMQLMVDAFARSPTRL